MRRNWIAVISAVIGGMAVLLAMSVWPPRSPVELRVVGVEPSRAIYYGGKEAILVTLSAINSDSIFVCYDIPAWEANVGGHWIEMQRFPGMIGMTTGGGMTAGAKREEKLLMPGGTEECRVQLSYSSGTWKSRLMARIGPTGRRWVETSRWLHKQVSPDPYEAANLQLWKSNTVQLAIPPSDRKPGVSLPSAHNN